MSVKCQVVMEAMDALAPRQLAEDWDNVGLLVGSPAQDIKKIIVTLDVTEETLVLAIEQDADMIVAHHPLIFKAMKHLRTDLPLGNMLARLIKNNIAVYAAHTNLDIAEGGVNDTLAAVLGLKESAVLSTTSTEKLVKLAVYIPETHAEAVREAITNAGAGHIGSYSHCTFQSTGLGKFMPLEGTQPFIGEIGRLETAHEVRLETIMPEKISRRVIRAMLKAHPYEEAAYDIYQLQNTGKTFGLGRIGKLPTAMSLADFALTVKEGLQLKTVNVVGNPDKSIRKVAVCGGAGTSLISKAAFAGADVLVTGDVGYHDGQAALSAGIAVIDGGHFATERVVVPRVAEYLKKYVQENKWDVEVIEDTLSTNVFSTY
jgi:dinuclear metal center YbgI/SA1388 family protein